MSASQPPSSARRAEARAAMTASLAAAGSAHSHALLTRVADLHANSAALSKQETTLVAQTAALATETAKWQKLAGESTKRMKEFGDLQNWAECIERDLLVVEETLRGVEGGEGERGASGTVGGGGVEGDWIGWLVGGAGEG
ncbi:hypothetical protein B0A49_12597 [Cryomyces minteri]|uniref:Biogenesis of lysosome-related organelles complex 1 subunit 1 n=1 Tax=Cryomyces minteri TaxID=331657 RepID=A0A4U0WGC1_9PEZI|nr:hypothetical protein B0A49_12597 [Cryomyces minteri]